MRHFGLGRAFSVRVTKRLKCWRPPAEDKGVTPTFVFTVSRLVGGKRPPEAPETHLQIPITAHTTSVVQVPVEGEHACVELDHLFVNKSRTQTIVGTLLNCCYQRTFISVCMNPGVCERDRFLLPPPHLSMTSHPLVSQKSQFLGMRHYCKCVFLGVELFIFSCHSLGL